MPTLSHAFPQEADAQLRRLARVGQAPGLGEPLDAPITKFDVETTIKDARRVIGLTTAEVMLLDVLMALTPKADWLAGHPLVFASNRTICRRSGFGERHLSRLIASLEAKGIVLRHYSANGKRWGLRGADDALVDGRGIDLSPLLSRLPAWRRALAEHQSAEAAHAHRARTITERRVRLRETIDAFVGSNADDRACDLLAALEDAVPPVWRTSRALRAAQDADLFQLEGRLAEIEVAVDELAEGMLAEQHKEQNDEFKESARADHRDIHQTRPKTQPEFSTSAQPRADTRDRPQSASLKTNKKNERRKAKAVSVAILKDALPTFWDQFGWIGLNDLNGFVRAAETAKSMIRVDERLWGEAHIALDHNRVLVAMLSAYVFERLNTEGPHGLSNPDGVGGYFRRCVERAAEGRLHLDASLYAAAQRHRKRQAEADDDLI